MRDSLYPQSYDRLLARNLRDKRAKYIMPQVAAGSIACADVTDNESVSDKTETVTSSDDLFEGIGRANKELDGNNDLNIPEQTNVEIQDGTFAKKAGSIFTRITNKHQKMLLII